MYLVIDIVDTFGIFINFRWFSSLLLNLQLLLLESHGVIFENTHLGASSFRLLWEALRQKCLRRLFIRIQSLIFVIISLIVWVVVFEDYISFGNSWSNPAVFEDTGCSFLLKISWQIYFGACVIDHVLDIWILNRLIKAQWHHSKLANINLNVHSFEVALKTILLLILNLLLHQLFLVFIIELLFDQFIELFADWISSEYAREFFHGQLALELSIAKLCWVEDLKSFLNEASVGSKA